jgi:hypothetical protein
VLLLFALSQVQVSLLLSAAAFLYVQGKQAVQDEQGVLSCLKRALKIANAAQQQVCEWVPAARWLPPH